MQSMARQTEAVIKDSFLETYCGAGGADVTLTSKRAVFSVLAWDHHLPICAVAVPCNSGASFVANTRARA
jgi:hypothetical protein